MRFLKITAALAGLSLIAAACSGDGATTTTSTTITTLPPVSSTSAAPAPPSTTTTSTTTTTTLGPQHPSPLNGLDVADPALLERRAIAVKVDNHWNARPQSGIEQAELVYEVLVEGGLTRFIAVFHTADSDYVGPIRSLRPTDPTLITFMDAPLQISGGQDWIQGVARGYGQRLIGDDRVSTYRISSRRGPHNLYGTTLEMRTTADRRGWPDEAPEPIFTFADPPVGRARAATITLDWSARPEVVWRYDPGSNTYLRFNRDDPHNWVTRDGEETQIETDTLLVLTARRYTASPRGSGTPVPALDTVGEGQALLFYDGWVAEGAWERETADEAFRLSLPSGIEMVVPPGRLWIAIFPTTGSVDW